MLLTLLQDALSAATQELHRMQKQVEFKKKLRDSFEGINDGSCPMKFETLNSNFKVVNVLLEFVKVQHKSYIKLESSEIMFHMGVASLVVKFKNISSQRIKDAYCCCYLEDSSLCYFLKCSVDPKEYGKCYSCLNIPFYCQESQIRVTLVFKVDGKRMFVNLGSKVVTNSHASAVKYPLQITLAFKYENSIFSLLQHIDPQRQFTIMCNKEYLHAVSIFRPLSVEIRNQNRYFSINVSAPTDVLILDFVKVLKEVTIKQMSLTSIELQKNMNFDNVRLILAKKDFTLELLSNLCSEISHLWSLTC